MLDIDNCTTIACCIGSVCYNTVGYGINGVSFVRVKVDAHVNMVIRSMVRFSPGGVDLQLMPQWIRHRLQHKHSFTGWRKETKKENWEKQQEQKPPDALNRLHKRALIRSY